MNSWCKNLELLIKSRTSLIWIRTKEEERLEKLVNIACERLNIKRFVSWDCVCGIKGLINEKGNKHSELYTSPLKYYEYLRGKLKVIAVDFPSHRSLMFSDKIIFFNLESRESLINALELSIKNETPFLEEDEIRKLSLEARATTIINFCFFQ